MICDVLVFFVVRVVCDVIILCKRDKVVVGSRRRFYMSHSTVFYELCVVQQSRHDANTFLI